MGSLSGAALANELDIMQVGPCCKKQLRSCGWCVPQPWWHTVRAVFLKRDDFFPLFVFG